MGSEPDNSKNADPADASREEGLARVASGQDVGQDGVTSGDPGGGGELTGDERSKTVDSQASAGQSDAGAETPKDTTVDAADASPNATAESSDVAGSEGGAGGEGVMASDDTEDAAQDEDEPEDDEDEDAEPIESLIEIEPEDENLEFNWYILKVQVNREESIREALLRRVKIHGLESMFEELVVPTEDVAEYNKAGKRRIVKKKLYPGYIMVRMAINDDSWFLVRETPGIGDFTGSAGKPTPMDPADAERIISRGKKEGEDEGQVKTSIPFKSGDQVRVKDGNFQGFEGDVESIDEAHGRVTVMINIFGRPTPVELEHWQIESV